MEWRVVGRCWRQAIFLFDCSQVCLTIPCVSNTLPQVCLSMSNTLPQVHLITLHKCV